MGGATSTVNSIHTDAIDQIAKVLDLVVKDNYTRSVLLEGDSGCGKSYLLARLKKTLNSKAFFAYIDSCPTSDSIWCHTLRHLVDSLMHRPEGEQESQLLLWLKGLSAFRHGGLMKRLLGEKGLFIKNFRSTYPTGIYQPKDFFGVLYQLTKNPDLFVLACDWLRGENLDQEELKLLGVSSVIDSEEAARGILGNFGRIADATKPIVLCFDQLDNGSRLPDGTLDLSPYFKVNTTLHNNHIKNFLVVISIVSHIWRTSQKTLPQSDLPRLNEYVALKDITLEQVKALWALRLSPLHRQAKPKPSSPIEPLNEQALQQRFPGGKANLRNALMLGRELFLSYRGEPEKEDTLAIFQLLWVKKFQENKAKIDRIRKFSSLDLIAMLKQALQALEIQIIKDKILPSKTYSSYSFSCQLPGRRETRGIFWNEEPNMGSFYFAMKACQKAINQNRCDSLILIRGEKLGNPKNKGYRLFEKIFDGSDHHHIIPQLESVYYLRTYQTLARDAREGDLVVGGETPNLQELEELMRRGNIFHDCPLLQDLEIVPPSNRGTRENVSQQTKSIENVPQKTKVIAKVSPQPGRVKLPAEAEVKDFVLDLVKTQKFIAVKVLIENCAQEQQFPKINTSEVKQIIHELCEAKLISIMNPQATVEEQLVCLIPQKDS